MTENQSIQLDARLLTRTKVKKRNNYSDYRDELRKDCCYSCVYCSIAELEASGIGFDIDHYIPRRIFSKTNPSLETDYYNLLYSCKVCNLKKSGYYPANEESSKKYYVLRPDRDILDNHLSLTENTMTSLTETGEFNIHKLSLNRQALKRLRDLRLRLAQSKKMVAFGVSRIRELNFDNLPTSIRAKALNNRKKLTDKADMIDEVIAQLSKSDLLDKDDSKSEFEKSRLAYLKKINSLGV